VPVYIEGADRALPRGALFIRPAKVRIVFGRPVTAGDMDLNNKPAGLDIHQYFADQLRQRVINLGRAGSQQA